MSYENPTYDNEEGLKKFVSIEMEQPGLFQSEKTKKREVLLLLAVVVLLILVITFIALYATARNHADDTEGYAAKQG